MTPISNPHIQFSDKYPSKEYQNKYILQMRLKKMDLIKIALKEKQ